MAIMAILHCFQTIRAKSGQNQGKKKGCFALISEYIIPIFRLFSFFRANGQKKTIEKLKIKKIYRVWRGKKAKIFLIQKNVTPPQKKYIYLKNKKSIEKFCPFALKGTTMAILRYFYLKFQGKTAFFFALILP